jgi:hypothetical protein
MTIKVSGLDIAKEVQQARHIVGGLRHFGSKNMIAPALA